MRWLTSAARLALKRGRPLWFSSIQSSAKVPLWMSLRIWRIALRVSSVTILGPAV